MTWLSWVFLVLLLYVIYKCRAYHKAVEAWWVKMEDYVTNHCQCEGPDPGRPPRGPGWPMS